MKKLNVVCPLFRPMKKLNVVCPLFRFPRALLRHLQPIVSRFRLHVTNRIRYRFLSSFHEHTFMSSNCSDSQNLLNTSNRIGDAVFLSNFRSQFRRALPHPAIADGGLKRGREPLHGQLAARDRSGANP